MAHRRSSSASRAALIFLLSASTSAHPRACVRARERVRARASLGLDAKCREQLAPACMLQRASPPDAVAPLAMRSSAAFEAQADREAGDGDRALRTGAAAAHGDRRTGGEGSTGGARRTCCGAAGVAGEAEAAGEGVGEGVAAGAAAAERPGAAA